METSKRCGIYQKLMPTTTMNVSESSPSFHDAHQGTSPDQQLSNSPASTSVADTPGQNSPVGQRRLFPSSPDAHADDNNNTTIARVDRRYTQLQELDLCLVEEDQKEEGDDGSNCDAAEFEDLVSSYANCLEVLVKKEDCNNLVDDHEENMTLVVRGLGEEVSVYSEPADWLVKKPKPKTEAGSRRTRIQ
jgi:hypothetical protein